MKKCLFLLAIAGLMGACKHKKLSLAGDNKVDLADFMESFPDVPLPFQVNDSSFDRDEPDSTLISYKVFTQFVPDSVVGRHFGKGASPHMYPLGKTRAGKKESYLFVKAVGSTRQWMYVVCFDKNHHFIASKSLFASGADRGVSSSAVLDNRYILTVMHQRKTTAGETFYKKDSYVFNDAGKFMLILTESNEAAGKSRPIINPIDTLPRKHKYSGDYVQDKFNFISVRDGRDASHIRFFVHFEKDDGDCKGELKGEAKLVAANVAHYITSGDPCSVNFSFTPTRVSMKELEGCGNHRDIKCFFEGSYIRLKEPKKKAVKKHHA